MFIAAAQKTDIPDQIGGIYSFKLKFPTMFELGLTNSDDTRGLDNVISCINRLSMAMKTGRFFGTLDNSNDSSPLANHLRVKYDVYMERVDALCWQEVETVVDACRTGGFPVSDLVKYFEFAVQCFPPVYIGIAYDQSLRSRYSQHESKQSVLRRRLRELNLYWSDLQYSYRQQDRLPKNLFVNVEKILQNIAIPIGCVR